MKIITSILFVFLLFMAGKASAQKATVHIAATRYRGPVSIFDPGVNYDPKKFISTINLACIIHKYTNGA